MNSRAALTVTLLLLLQTIGQGQDHAWRLRYAGGINIGLGINPLNPNTVFALQRDISLHSDSLIVSYDRGKTWNVLSVQPVGYLNSAPILHTVDTLVMFDISGHDLRRSLDYGLTWTTVLSTPWWVESVEIDPITPDKIYAGVYDGSIYRSTDRGVNWESFSRVDSGLCDLVIRPDSTNILYAGTAGMVGKIWKSTDSGFTWRVTTTTTEYYVSHLAIDSYNPSVAYATTAEGPQQGVWKTSDWGEHWGPVFINYHGWYVDIDRSSPGIVYVSNYLGPAPVRSTDEGLSWEALDQGFPGTFVNDIRVHPLNSDIIWVGEEPGAYRWAPLVSTVTGIVLNDVTGKPVTNGFIELASTGERVMLDSSGGSYSFHYYEDDPILSSTVHVEAFPYYLHDETIDFIVDSTTSLDIRLTKLPLSSVAGTVEDSVSHAPVLAEVSFSSTTSLGTATYSTMTKPDGSFLIDSLFISQPPVISYGDISVHPDFPFASVKLPAPVVDTAQYVVVAPVDTADVLVSSSASSGDFSVWYTEALDTLNRSYFYWNPVEQGVAPMGRAAEMRKRVMIYYTGVDTTELPEAELDSLNEALSSGVNLFITGQNFVEENTSSYFVSQVLGLGYVGTANIASCRGFAGEIFGSIQFFTSFGSGANDQVSRDILQIIGPDPLPVLGYGISGNQGIAGVRMDSLGGNARVVLFGFGFEAINTLSSRMSIMQTILGYFDGSSVVGVQETSPSQPLSYQLEQNYPNPFNPKTDVRYEISDVGFVTLVVYDILGREVATLVNEKKSPGRYSVTWDASGQASGVYFYRLQAGNFTETRKLVLVR